MSLTLLLLMILVPAAICGGALWSLLPRDDEIVVAASGFVVVRD